VVWIVGNNFVQGLATVWIANHGALVFCFSDDDPARPDLVWLPVSINGSTAMAVASVWSFVILIRSRMCPALPDQPRRLPILLILLGMLGGLAAFGLLGIFVGPTILAIGHALVTEWVEPLPHSPD
jgi:predicted PurR-regulated permease PerM